MNATPACLIDAAYGDPCPAGLPVSVGVPFPAGTLTDAASLVVKAPSGERRPAAGRILARSPDGSIRWCLVSFGAREPGPHEVLGAESAGRPAPAVALRQDGGNWTIDSGRLRLRVCETGPGVLGDLVGDGHPYLAAPENLRFCVDDASTLHETRRTVRVIEPSAPRSFVSAKAAPCGGPATTPRAPPPGSTRCRK